MTAVELNTATMVDADRLLPLVRAYHEFESISMTDADRRRALAPLLAADSPLGRAYLIGEGDGLVGYVALCFGYSIEFGGRDAFIDELYLIAGARGRGIGSEVLQRLPALAAADGIRALHLEVAEGNEAAKRLYQRCGFESRDRFHLMSRRL